MPTSGADAPTFGRSAPDSFSRITRQKVMQHRSPVDRRAVGYQGRNFDRVIEFRRTGTQLTRLRKGAIIDREAAQAVSGREVRLMMTTQILQNGDSQLVRLPSGFEFAEPEVGIRRDGEAVILEPIKSLTWPNDFFARIRIDDPAFVRPDQGMMPGAPRL